MSTKNTLLAIIGIILAWIGTLIPAVYLFSPLLREPSLPLSCEHQEREFIISMKQKCWEEGKEIYLDDKNKFKDYELCEPLYNYIKDWDTCIYYGCYKEEGEITKEWIMDIYKNEVVASKPSPDSAEFSLDSDYVIEGGLIDLTSLENATILTLGSSSDWNEFWNEISKDTPSLDIDTSSWVISTTSPWDTSPTSRTVFPLSNSLFIVDTKEFARLKEKLFSNTSLFK